MVYNVTWKDATMQVSNICVYFFFLLPRSGVSKEQGEWLAALIHALGHSDILIHVFGHSDISLNLLRAKLSLKRKPDCQLLAETTAENFTLVSAYSQPSTCTCP